MFSSHGFQGMGGPTAWPCTRPKTPPQPQKPALTSHVFSQLHFYHFERNPNPNNPHSRGCPNPRRKSVVFEQVTYKGRVLVLVSKLCEKVRPSSGPNGKGRMVQPHFRSMKSRQYVHGIMVVVVVLITLLFWL